MDARETSRAEENARHKANINEIRSVYLHNRLVATIRHWEVMGMTGCPRALVDHAHVAVLTAMLAEVREEIALGKLGK